MKANPHIIPFRECPLCGNTEVDLIDLSEDYYKNEEDVIYGYIISCECGIEFGHPYGYSSRLDLATDWNIRHNEKVNYENIYY